MDLSDLLGTNASGLLNAPQQGDVNSQTLEGIAAGLLRAAGPSPYKAKMTTLSGIGEGIQGGMAARKSAFDDLLKQKYVNAQTAKLSQEQVLQAAQMAAEYKAAGLPVHPAIQHILDAASGGAGQGGIGAGPPGMPPGAAGAYGQAPQQAQPMPQGQPQPQQPAPQGTIMSPTGASSFPPGSPAARVQALGLSPFGLVSKGPMANVTQSALEGNIKATDPAIENNERRGAIMKEDVARDAKLYPALTSLGQQGYVAKQDAELSSALVKDPGFYSGAGQGLNEAWQKFKVSIGADPNLAFSQEAFRKITASNINTQIGEMKATAAEMGGAAGRIFQNQTALMEKASQNLDVTPAANRFLASLQGRAADYNIAVGDMATAYKKQHGILDTGFDEQLSKYTRDHPLFTKAELGNLRQIATPGSGAPAAPAPPPVGSNGPSTAPQPAAPTKTAVGPGGKRLGLVNGQWVPIQ